MQSFDYIGLYENTNMVIFVRNICTAFIFFSIRTSIDSASLNDFREITRMDLTFDPQERTKVVEIQISDDLVVENDEDFFVSLETTHPRVVFSRSSTTVRIEDNDS